MAKKKKFNKDAYIRQIVLDLTNEGGRIIELAYKSRGFHNRTRNLKDSYASAVYVNGNLRYDSIRFIGADDGVTKERQNISAENKTMRELGDYAGDRTRPVYRGGDRRYLTGDTVRVHGRDEAIRFFNDYKPAKDSGIQLVVIAAMFYAGIVESYGYQVLSRSNTELLTLASKYGNKCTVKKLDIWRDYDAVGPGSFTIKNEL